GSLRRREVGRFPPGRDREDAVVGGAGLLQLARVHLDADAAPVDLARPQLDQHRGLGPQGSPRGVAPPPQRPQRVRELHHGVGDSGFTDPRRHDFLLGLGGPAVTPARRSWSMGYDQPPRRNVTMSRIETRAAQFESERTRLRAVAYRMLGSLSEAEDAVQ